MIVRFYGYEIWHLMKGISSKTNPYAIFLNNYLETRFVNCELLDSLVVHAHQTWSRTLAGTILLKNISKHVWNHYPIILNTIVPFGMVEQNYLYLFWPYLAVEGDIFYLFLFVVDFSSLFCGSWHKLVYFTQFEKAWNDPKGHYKWSYLVTSKPIPNKVKLLKDLKY